jgi:diguanylate cyclase (GGDEF)-like protein
MISLKKFLDSQGVGSADVSASSGAEKEEPESGSVLAAYQAALSSMGASGQRAVPMLGAMLSTALARIGHALSQTATSDAVRDARRHVDEALFLWADKAQENQKQSEQTVRELLLVVFEATESTGNRDEKFSREITDLSDRLRRVAGLDNLPLIRRSIMENTNALNKSVTKMAEEGRESIRKLTSEIADYQSRLMASERRALIDPLTCLANRRGFEQQLAQRVQSGQPFSLLVVDLNGFKATNDRYGHIVGDEILKRFASELKAQFLSEDTVARWGGDEFVGIVAGPAREGTARADRVRHWVLGEYELTLDDQTIRVVVDAALGTVAWNGTESGLELFDRGDKEMYRVKQASRELV